MVRFSTEKRTRTHLRVDEGDDWVHLRDDKLPGLDEGNLARRRHVFGVGAHLEREVQASHVEVGLQFGHICNSKGGESMLGTFKITCLNTEARSVVRQQNLLHFEGLI